LPVPLTRIYDETVSPMLGADFVKLSAIAGIIGTILVMLFMILYYRIPGVVASIALLFYASLVLAIFKLWPGGGVTLTLAGIGGFVLSVGMAVDANVLIFERVKEELNAGRTLGAAIEAGFSRAWSAIWDSNFTTFIVCAILYWLGSSIVASAPVMGFALTLFIGVACSMITATLVSRTMLRLFVGSRLAKKVSLFTPTGVKKDV
jgi:preprotein translocase subunit SecD